MVKSIIKSEKIYFTVGEIASMLNVNESLIRFWNKEFDKLLNPHRNKRGVRFFSEKDVETYRKIYQLVKERGYTLPGALEVLKSDTPGSDQNFEIIKTLSTIKQFLLELKEEI
jgi:DNA-binding transcriptional MerR regulator